MKTYKELKPCPFCGCEKVVIGEPSYDVLRSSPDIILMRIMCTNPECFAQVVYSFDFEEWVLNREGAKKECAKRWNRRQA